MCKRTVFLALLLGFGIFLTSFFQKKLVAQQPDTCSANVADAQIIGSQDVNGSNGQTLYVQYSVDFECSSGTLAGCGVCAEGKVAQGNSQDPSTYDPVNGSTSSASSPPNFSCGQDYNYQFNYQYGPTDACYQYYEVYTNFYKLDDSGNCDSGAFKTGHMQSTLFDNPFPRRCL